MKEKILAFVRLRGPLIPKTVAKEFRFDTTFAGAYLSELAGEKKILISSTKIGGSPTYYVAEQKEKLQELSVYLNEKDRATFNFLREKKILRDKEQQPLVRASLRAIKDFAVPLQVNIQPEPELFWKWYLLTKEEAETIIKTQLTAQGQQEPETNNEEAPAEKQQEREEKKQQPAEEIKETRNNETRNETRVRIEEIQAVPGKAEAKAEYKTEQPSLGKKEQEQTHNQTPEQEEKIHASTEEMKPAHIPLAKERYAETQAQPAATAQANAPAVDEKKQKKKIQKKPVETSPEFINLVNKYFAANKIQATHSEIIKKTEIDFIIKIPSVVGELEYYCKAKKKKKCNEGDLSSAFVAGQSRKLPVLFLATGDITKKAHEMLSKEFKNHLVFKKI